MKIRIKNIPELTFVDGIAKILEGCELTVATGEEDSSFFLRNQEQRLGNADYLEFNFSDIADSIRRKNGDDSTRKFTSLYTSRFGLLSLIAPVQIKVSWIEIVH